MARRRPCVSRGCWLKQPRGASIPRRSSRDETSRRRLSRGTRGTHTCQVSLSFWTESIGWAGTCRPCEVQSFELEIGVVLDFLSELAANVQYVQAVPRKEPPRAAEAGLGVIEVDGRRTVDDFGPDLGSDFDGDPGQVRLPIAIFQVGFGRRHVQIRLLRWTVEDVLTPEVVKSNRKSHATGAHGPRRGGGGPQLPWA